MMSITDLYRIDTFKVLVKNPIRSEEYSDRKIWLEAIAKKSQELTPESYNYYRYDIDNNRWIEVSESEITEDKA